MPILRSHQRMWILQSLIAPPAHSYALAMHPLLRTMHILWSILVHSSTLGPLVSSLRFLYIFHLSVYHVLSSDVSAGGLGLLQSFFSTLSMHRLLWHCVAPCNLCAIWCRSHSLACIIVGCLHSLRMCSCESMSSHSLHLPSLSFSSELKCLPLIFSIWEKERVYDCAYARTPQAHRELAYFNFSSYSNND